MAKLVVRPATAEDIATFSGNLPNRPTVRAVVGEIDGRIVGMGGFARTNARWIAFCDLTPEVRPYKMTIMRTALRLLCEARRDGIRFVYADADLNEPRSLAWLARLGFEPDPRSGTLYRWSS